MSGTSWQSRSKCSAAIPKSQPLRCVCYIIPEFPCIFPAGREFPNPETGSLETASSSGESCRTVPDVGDRWFASTSFEAVTLMGSYNWTRGAAANSENLNLVSSPAITAAYAAHWRARLAVSVRYARREDCCRVSSTEDRLRTR